MTSPAGNTHDEIFTGDFVDELIDLRHKMNQVKLIRMLSGPGSDQTDKAWDDLTNYTEKLEQKYNCIFQVSVLAGQITKKPFLKITDEQRCKRHGKCRPSCKDRIDYELKKTDL